MASPRTSAWEAKFVPVRSCEGSRVPPLNRHSHFSIAEDLFGLKAVDIKFVRNEGNILNTDAFVAEQIADKSLTNHYSSQGRSQTSEQDEANLRHLRREPLGESEGKPPPPP